MAINIRRFVVKADRLEDLVALGTLTRQAADFLDGAVHAGLQVLVRGHPGGQDHARQLDETAYLS